jgi:hypothetical protein
VTRSTLRQSKPRVSRMVLRRMPQHATAIVSRAVKRTTVGWSRKTFYSLHCSRNSRNIELLSSFVHSLRPRLLFSQTNFVRPSKTQCLGTPTNSIFFFDCIVSVRDVEIRQLGKSMGGRAKCRTARSSSRKCLDHMASRSSTQTLMFPERATPLCVLEDMKMLLQ